MIVKTTSGAKATTMLWFRICHWPKAAAYGVAGLALVYAVGLGPWFSIWQGVPVGWRFAIAGLTIAPLAIPMGMLFPAGLVRISLSGHELIPWAWAVNGTFSVAAAVATPLVAMQWGFSRVIFVAVVCYAMAGALFLLLHRRGLSLGGMRDRK